MTAAIDKNDTISPIINTPETSSLPSVKTLFVWDFDWTIVNCNSDEYVPAKFLGDETTNTRFHELIDELGPEKWHDCVATLINSCITKSISSSSSRGDNDDRKECTTKQDICEAAASMPFLSNVKAALDTVANANNDTLLSNNCGQMILSDGNDEFVHAFLKKNGLETSFSHGVETNFARWATTTTTDSDEDDGDGEIMTKEVFSVVHQSTKYGGHDCPRCPPNLCKTQVLRDVLSRMNDDNDGNNATTTPSSTTSKPRIVYVGDGSNDTCPALNVLTEGDVLLARDGCKISNPNTKVGNQFDEGNVIYSDSTETTRGSSKFPILAVLERAKKREGLVPKCKVCPWTSGTELFELVESILNEN